MSAAAVRYNRGTVDQVTRDRIRAWIVHEMKRRQIGSIRELAEMIEVNHAYLSRVIAGEQTAGLELVLRLNRKLHISIDAMVNSEPTSR